MKAGKWFARLLVLVLTICALHVGGAEEAEPAAPGVHSRAGEFVFYGIYPQTADGADSTPIEWLVLENDGESVLLISRCALDCQPYHDVYIKTTWERCALRAWLNEAFYNQAFREGEKEHILQTDVSADRNPNYGSDPGKATTDRVFLLSIDEANRYFADDAARACAPTDYALRQGALTSDVNQADGRMACWFWLRTPGHQSNYVSLVSTSGVMNDGGCRVTGEFIAVRPCVRVRLS